MMLNRRNAVIGLFFLAALAVALGFIPRTSGQATTQPALSITPPARQLLGQVRDAYGSLKSLKVTGTLTGQFDVDGEKHLNSGKFNGLWKSGGQFRSEMEETSDASATTQPSADAILGNTGDKVYLYLPMRNRYLEMPTPAGKLTLDGLGSDLSDVLRNQDLSLTLALASDAAAMLSEDAIAMVRLDDQVVDGQSLAALEVLYPRYDLTMLIDPQSHLVRRAMLDLQKNARLLGAKDIKSAQLTIDYQNLPGATAENATFGWNPPPGAQPLDTGPNSGAEIEGKPAPAFTLQDLNGKQVSLQSLRGSVVVLDFWATWCGPCVASLPQLENISKTYAPKGVKFFAINQAEDQDTVQKFVNDTKLSIPVLLDSDAKVGGAYDSENAIPFTVVIGKDGVVFKAGLFAADEDQLRPIIDAAMKK